MKFSFTLKSRNTKTGEIPISMTTKDSCPNACPLKDKSCYAGLGQVSWAWNKMNKTGKSFHSLLSQIKSLPAGQLMRYNVAGDLPGENNKIDTSMLKKLVSASKGLKVFTYTHKPVLTNKKNAAAVKSANKNGLTINLSANSPDEVDALLNLKIGPVVTVAPINCENTFYTKAGNKIIKCPAVYKEGVTCSTCKLCSISNRSVTIAFPAHGIRKNLLNDTFQVG